MWPTPPVTFAKLRGDAPATRARSARPTAPGRGPTPSSTSAHTNVCANAWASGLTILACWAGDRVCSDANPLPPWRTAGIELSRSLIAVDSSTVITAVPIDAPPWRMMFIAVLTRGIASRGTACIAAVIVGIIASPMPSPSTTLKPDSSTYEVVEVTNANGASPISSSGIPAAGRYFGP
jgi:hypothetical protein